MKFIPSRIFEIWTVKGRVRNNQFSDNPINFRTIQSIFGQSILVEWKMKGIQPKHLPVYLYICPLKSASSNAKRRELQKPELVIQPSLANQFSDEFVLFLEIYIG